jgi:hypothetical protein
MFPFNKKLSFKKLSSGLIILIFLATMFGNLVLPPPKKADAMLAMLANQIIQYILDNMSWSKDYSVQKSQKDYAKLTSEIQQWFKDDTLEQRSLNESWNEDRYELLKEMSDNIVEWAQGEEGNRNFVLDWQGFLVDKAQQAGQQFVDEELNKIVLCDAFSQQVIEGITGDSNASSGGATDCPVQDLETFYGDFEQGGWDAWDQATEPTGFSIGAFLMASDALTEKVGLAFETEKDKLNANQGFVGDEEKGTPGIIQSYASQRASMMDFDYLLESDQIDEFFSSVADAFITRIIDEGLGEMSTGDDYQNQGEPPCYTPDCLLEQEEEDVNYIISRYTYAEQLGDVLEVVTENLETMLSEQSLNLTLLEEINEIEANCANSTSAALIAELEAEIAQTEEKISQAETASTNVADLIIAMETVIDANDTGDEELLAAALEDYNTASDTAIASLQTLLETEETDLMHLYEEANDYTEQIVSDTSEYVASRGPAQSDWQLPELLYGWLACLNSLGCSSLCVP